MSSSSSLYWQLLKKYLLQQRGRVFLLSALVLGSIALALINPQIIRYFIDTATLGAADIDTATASASTNGTQQLLGAATLFIVITIVQQAFVLGATYVGENVGWIATNQLRADLSLHMLKLDLAFHKTHTPGELIERVDGDVNQLAQFFSQLVINLLGNLLLFFGVLVMLWVEGWQIGLSITVVVALGVAAIEWLRRRIVPRWEAARATEAALFGFLEERLNGTEDIRANGAEAYTMNRLYHLMRERWLAMRHTMKLDVFVISFPIWIFGVAYAVAHFIGGNLYFSQGLTIGSVYLIFHYIGLMEGPLWSTMRQVEELQKAGASINRIARLFAIQPTIEDGPGIPLEKGPIAVAFNDVYFAYTDVEHDDARYKLSNDDETDSTDIALSTQAVTGSTATRGGFNQNRFNQNGTDESDDVDEIVIDGLTFTLEAGKIMGLLGRTGSGKSTISKLLYRFYDPTDGSVRIGQNDNSNSSGATHDLRQAKRSQLRNRIALVTQDVQIFRASVRDNVTMFGSIQLQGQPITDAAINTVLTDVGLGEWLDSLPTGLDTRLDGARGSLSAGEAQLLAFGRIFLSDPGLIILDEASSRLDPATETKVERALDQLLQNRTVIIIAHRLATVQRADEILILERGRVLEHGPRTALEADPTSHFSYLLKTGLSQEEIDKI